MDRVCDGDFFAFATAPPLYLVLVCEALVIGSCERMETDVPITSGEFVPSAIRSYLALSMVFFAHHL